VSVLEARLAVDRSRFADFVELTKPRITFMILFTVFVGLVLGTGGRLGPVLLPTLLGTALVSSGASALNQYLERGLDARMRRTASRPLPAGRLRPVDALAFGLALSATGIVLLASFVNPLTALLATVTLVTYVLVYTPLKPITTLSTLVGAVPGALPPVGGWAAATGGLGPEALTLFTILFLWQIPHFLAIAWLYREDYARGGLRMLSVADSTGRATARQVLLYTAALLPATLLPASVGLGGRIYVGGALLLGAGFAASAMLFARRRTSVEARHLLLVSVLYLPLLLSLLLVNRGPV
jgi:heme o synthase